MSAAPLPADRTGTVVRAVVEQPAEPRVPTAERGSCHDLTATAHRRAEEAARERLAPPD